MNEDIVLMIILLSPAKSLDFETKATVERHSDLLFPEKAAYLAGKLAKMSAAKLKSMMDISEDLAQLNAERFQNWDIASLDSQGKQALFAFVGDVYQGLDANSLSEGDLEYAQDHVRILSGLYGMLRPLDTMLPYRLEMGTTWKITPKKNNLYAYWKDTLTAQLKSEIKRNNSAFVLNLASQEYAKAVDFKKFPIPVVAPEFKEERNEGFQMISFFAKKARGMMTAFAVKHQISKPEDLKSFDSEGYLFNESLSNVDSNKWVFTRKTK